MVNVQSAIPMCDLPPLCESVTNAPSATIKTNALYVEERASRMLSTVLSAQGWRRIAMAVRKLSILEVRGRISSIRRRISAITERRVKLGGYQLMGRSNVHARPMVHTL